MGSAGLAGVGMPGTAGAASREWATRPPDESYASLEALMEAVTERTRRGKEFKGVDFGGLRAEARDGDVQLRGADGVLNRLTHWSFGQLSGLVKAPTKHLREWPAKLVEQVLNHLIGRRAAKEELQLGQLLVDVDPETGARTIRGFTGDGYERIWDLEIVDRLRRLGEQGWYPAPETELATQRANGEVAVSRGLYASDHDVFAFMVDNERRIFEADPAGGLSRGFIVANSEVGDKSFWITSFLYSYVCANHNIWGIEGIQEVRIAHRAGATGKAWGDMEARLKAYAESSAGDEEAKILRCRLSEIGASKAEVLNKLFSMKSLGLSREVLGAAWDAAEQHESWYGAPPNTAWGMGNGVTEIARGIEHADKRWEVERAAGEIFERGREGGEGGF